MIKGEDNKKKKSMVIKGKGDKKKSTVMDQGKGDKKKRKAKGGESQEH